MNKKPEVSIVKLPVFYIYGECVLGYALQMCKVGKNVIYSQSVRVV